MLCKSFSVLVSTQGTASIHKDEQICLEKDREQRRLNYIQKRWIPFYYLNQTFFDVMCNYK